jgi:hypothetical protein
VPLAAGDWDVSDSVDLEMLNSQPNVVFAARPVLGEYDDIWWYHPVDDTGEPNTPATNLSNTANQHEASPRLVEETSTFVDVPVIAWRTVEYLLQDVQVTTGNAGYCAGDVWMFYGGLAEPERLFDDQGTCANSGFDLDARNEWVGGMWEDEVSPADDDHVAWTTFNIYRVDLPLVSR